MSESLGELGESLAGTLIGPADAEYDAARRCFNALVDRRPAKGHFVRELPDELLESCSGASSPWAGHPAGS